MGFKIPDDLSLVGFDNIPESAFFNLTTVDQFIAEMGYVATKMLIDSINGIPLENKIHKMQTQLIIRGSCQSPRATD
jgi:DNA-binding LacI/PurR family transcriptional regulator